MAEFEESTYYVVSGILSRGRVARAESSHLSSNLLCLLAPIDETRLSMWMLIMPSVSFRGQHDLLQLFPFFSDEKK